MCVVCGVWWGVREWKKDQQQPRRVMMMQGKEAPNQWLGKRAAPALHKHANKRVRGRWSRGGTECLVWLCM